MAEEINRVAIELKAWKEREKEWRELFPEILDQNKGFIRAKLKFYEGLSSKNYGGLNQTEQMTLAIARQEGRDFVKVSYPKFFTRLARNIVAVVKRQLNRSKDIAVPIEPAANLKDLLRRSGFSRMIGKLEDNIKLGLSSFRLSDAHYINEKEFIDYQLKVERRPNGEYVLEGYKATLTDEHNQKRSHYFEPEGKVLMSSEHSQSLLSGAAILVKERVDNLVQSRWIQFNLNDKRPDGQYVVKEFSSDYGFDLDSTLRAMPFNVGITQGKYELLVEGMRNGKRMEVSHEIDGRIQKIYLAANPQMKTIDVFNEKGKKVFLERSNGPSVTKSSPRMEQKQDDNRQQVNRPNIKPERRNYRSKRNRR